MRHLLEVLPGAEMPDPLKESDSPGTVLVPPDDDDLVRPAGEEDLFPSMDKGSLTGRQPGALAKHLVHTFGPVHAALPFPIALRVELDGDRLVTVDPEVGFLHQGIERAAELVEVERVPHIVARASPLAPLPLQIATVVAIERLCGVAAAIPRRAVLWRLAALELARIAEHLRLASLPALAPAASALRRTLQEAARDASGLLDALTAGGTFARAGGLVRPLDGDEAGRVLAALPRFADAARAAREAVDDDPTLDAHINGLGPLTGAVALSYGVSGPALRACGVVDDVRLHDETFGFRAFGFRACVETTGCARARVRVRLAEVGVSAALAGRALESLPDVPPETAVAVGRPRAGVASASVEAHHGEVAVVVAADGDGTGSAVRLRRVRIRTPSAPVTAALARALRGDRIDDVVTVLASFGIVGTEGDR